MTIAERVADYLASLRYEDLPQPVVGRAKDLLVFHLGVAFRGRAMRSGQQAVQLALELSGAGGKCSIIGEPHRVGLLEAVFANSLIMTSVGTGDGLFPSGVAPGITVHPAAWAMGEAVRASGRELLTAVTAGYDVMAKLHNGALPYEQAVPRPTKFVVEPFGVAATAARLLKLSREQMVHAMGHAGQAVMSTYEGILTNELLHPLASRNGAMAAMLAKAGQPGPRTIVEGPHGIYRMHFLEDVPDCVYGNLSTLGKDFEILRAYPNSYSVSAGNWWPVELTQQLVAEHGLTADQVTAIDLVLPKSRESREAIYGTYPKGPSTLVAMILTDGRLDPSRFEDELSAEVLAAREKVRLRFEDGHAFFYVRVEIATSDGQHHVAEGDGLYTPTTPEWSEWLTEGGRTFLTHQQLSRLADLIRRLEDVPDVAEVMACVVPAAASR